MLNALSELNGRDVTELLLEISLDHLHRVSQLDHDHVCIVISNELLTGFCIPRADSEVMPRDPSLLHICALLTRMDDRMENIENRIDELMEGISQWTDYNDAASEYTLESEESESASEEAQAQEVPRVITIGGRTYVMELVVPVE